MYVVFSRLHPSLKPCSYSTKLSPYSKQVRELCPQLPRPGSPGPASRPPGLETLNRPPAPARSLARHQSRSLYGATSGVECFYPLEHATGYEKTG